jgi:hypothetical protein
MAIAALSCAPTNVFHGGEHHHHYHCGCHHMHRRCPDHDHNEWREVEPPRVQKPRGLFATMTRAVSSRIIVGVATAAMVLTPIIAMVVVLVL